MKGGKRNTNTKNMLTFEKDYVIEGVPNHSNGFSFVEMSQCRNFSSTEPSTTLILKPKNTVKLFSSCKTQHKSVFEGGGSYRELQMSRGHVIHLIFGAFSFKFSLFSNSCLISQNY